MRKPSLAPSYPAPPTDPSDSGRSVNPPRTSKARAFYQTFMGSHFSTVVRIVAWVLVTFALVIFVFGLVFHFRREMFEIEQGTRNDVAHQDLAS